MFEKIKCFILDMDGTIYVGIYSTVVALISAACALALKARHDRGEK